MYEFMSDIKKVDLGGGGASIYIYIYIVLFFYGTVRPIECHTHQPSSAMISPFAWMQGEELHELHDFKAQIDVLNVARQLQCF